MPDVKVRFPRMLFINGKSFNPQAHWRMMELLATTVAEALSSKDYNGEDLVLSSTGVDVHLMPYASDDVLFHGASVLVEVTAYDFPDRMKTLKARLALVQDALTSFLVEGTNYEVKDKLVSVTFIPLKDDCWV